MSYHIDETQVSKGYDATNATFTPGGMDAQVGTKLVVQRVCLGVKTEDDILLLSGVDEEFRFFAGNKWFVGADFGKKPIRLPANTAFKIGKVGDAATPVSYRIDYKRVQA